jgi:FkbM family methyltransferase
MEQFLAHIKKHIPDTSDYIILDIGSKDGGDARSLMNGLSIPGDRVYALEAHPTEYEIHRDTNADIHWLNMAIYEYDGEVTFYPKNIGSGIHSIRDRGAEFGSGTLQVCCKRMDTLLEEHGLKAPMIVKVDVEGCSLEVLKSFGIYINRVHVFHMETECEAYFKEQHLQDEVFTYLTEHGFVMTMYSTTDGSNQHDSVWVRS